MFKRCSKCGGGGPFYRNKATNDGLTGQCRACIKARVAAYHKSTGYASNKKYQATPRGIEIHNRINRGYYRTQDAKDRNRLTKTRSPIDFLRYKLVNIRARARWVVEIDLEYLVQLYDEQDHKCNISGVTMTHQYNDLCSVSIDRIDSKGGYVKGNVQLVCRAANLAKQHHPNDAAIEFFKKVKISG